MGTKSIGLRIAKTVLEKMREMESLVLLCMKKYYEDSMIEFATDSQTDKRKILETDFYMQALDKRWRWHCEVAGQGRQSSQ